MRPRGLGGTPIKKNHPKRRKLRFYPPCISYPRPLVKNWWSYEQFNMKAFLSRGEHLLDPIVHRNSGARLAKFRF
jgi:hypothetical protein